MTAPLPLCLIAVCAQFFFYSTWAQVKNVVVSAAELAAPSDPSQFSFVEQEASVTDTHGVKASLGGEAFDRRREVPGASRVGARAVLDFRRDWRINPDTQFTLSNRLEVVADDHGNSRGSNALREAFASWRGSDDWFVDAGRINLRSGVGSGFNPTDWLREGAAIAQTTQNPTSLRENRLGTVMLRGQTVQSWGAAHLALVPHLAARDADTSPYGMAWGRTNEDRAMHLRLAPKVSDTVSLDLLTYARQGRQLQWGANVTSVLSDAFILHGELAVGKRVGLTAPGQAAEEKWHQRLATGVSWTSAQGATVTLERHLTTDGLNRSNWDAWRLADSGAAQGQLAQLRSQRLDRQDPLVRDAWFARAAITGIGADADIDTAAFARMNAYDRSYLWQLDATWHVQPRTSLYASLGGYAGTNRSEFGSNPVRTWLSVRLETVF